MPLRAAKGIALALIVLVWAVPRLVPAWGEISPESGGTVLLGNDPWFHLHQVKGAVEHFPRLLRWDVGAWYPEGGRVAASGLFHLGHAAVARVMGIGAGDTERVAAILAWSPVLLGAASIICLFGLAREIGGSRLAWTTLILRVVFPGGELERTLCGFGDQHAAEIFLITAGLWAWARHLGGGFFPGKMGEWTGGGIAALPVAALLFTWFGAPLQVAILIAAWWMMEVLAVCQGEDIGWWRRRALGFFGGIFLITGATGILWNEGVMVPEAWRFTLAALVLQMALMGLVAWFSRRCSAIMKRAPMVSGWILVVGLALPAAGFLWWNPTVLSLAWNFLGAANPAISEHAAGPLAGWWMDYGLILPWIVVGIMAGLGKGGHQAGRLILSVIGLWAIVAALRSDFYYLTGALFPLAAASGGWWFVERMRGWQVRRPAAIPLASLAITMLLIWPGGLVRAPVMSRGEVAGMVVATRPWREAMDWLRTETPKPAVAPTYPAPPWRKRDGFSYPEGTDAVFTHWQYGNLVPALGERIAVSARSRSPEFIEWFLEQDEPASHRRLDAIGEVRYLVLDATSVCDLFPAEALQAGLTPLEIQVADGEVWEGVRLRSFGDPFRRSLGANLYLGDGTAMERYRLVHESTGLSFVRYRMRTEEELVTLKSDLVEPSDLESLRPLLRSGGVWREEGSYLCYSGQILPAVKVFERVRGAILEGVAPPGVEVALELRIVVPGSGREIHYRREATAGPEGKVSFRVPYATEVDGASPEGKAGRYRISGDGVADREVEVGEAAVQSGAVIVF